MGQGPNSLPKLTRYSVQPSYSNQQGGWAQHGRQFDMDLEYRESTAESTFAPSSETQASKKVTEAGAKLAAEMQVFDQVAAEVQCKRNPDASHEDRCSQVLREASELFGVAPVWTAFYRAVLGVGGCARSLFPSAEEYYCYETSDVHDKVLEMLTVLRSRDTTEGDPCEPQRMITVRIPKSMHDSICQEANDLKVSVNKLCITRLLQRVDRQLIPTSTQKRRGRRPGAEYTKSSSTSTNASGMEVSLADTALTTNYMEAEAHS